MLLLIVADMRPIVSKRKNHREKYARNLLSRQVPFPQALEANQ